MSKRVALILHFKFLTLASAHIIDGRVSTVEAGVPCRRLLSLRVEIWELGPRGSRGSGEARSYLESLLRESKQNLLMD